MKFINWFLEILDKKVKAWEYEKQITKELEEIKNNPNWDWDNYDNYVEHIEHVLSVF